MRLRGALSRVGVSVCVAGCAEQELQLRRGWLEERGAPHRPLRAPQRPNQALHLTRPCSLFPVASCAPLLRSGVAAGQVSCVVRPCQRPRLRGEELRLRGTRPSARRVAPPPCVARRAGTPWSHLRSAPEAEPGAAPDPATWFVWHSALRVWSAGCDPGRAGELGRSAAGER